MFPKSNIQGFIFIVLSFFTGSMANRVQTNHKELTAALGERAQLVCTSTKPYLACLFRMPDGNTKFIPPKGAK